VLIKWVNTVAEKSIWEDYNKIAQKYLEFILRDKDIVKGGRVLAEELLQR
jgi:hypothetical protein